jgi:hypothetical protein
MRSENAFARLVLSLFAVCRLITGSSDGQTLPPAQFSQFHFSTGQNVVPVYEGWLRNADGTFSIVFGYFNRNFKEEPVIPAGPNNNVEPGGPDRGQPTYFLPRRHSFLFRINVPKDWGQKEVVWTIVLHGRTERAYGSLLPVKEISERFIMAHGGLNPGDDDPNKPPSITISPVRDTGLTGVVTLTAVVEDDGLPKPRPGALPTGDIHSLGAVGRRGFM